MTTHVLQQILGSVAMTNLFLSVWSETVRQQIEHQFHLYLKYKANLLPISFCQNNVLLA